MTAGSEHGSRRGIFIAAAATALFTIVGLTLVVLGIDASDGPEGPTAEDSSMAAAASDGPGRPAAGAPSLPRAARSNEPAIGNPAAFGTFLPGSPPVGLEIPSINVRATDIVDLGLQDDGSIEVPNDPSAPGWFTPGPTPGQLGPAVIAGHVDSTTGPAVFYHLGQLRPGAAVHVTREDGSIATFSVDRVVTYPKDNFPTNAVYGATKRAELRLITCSGDYDNDTGYDSNTVAFARLI